MPTRTRKKARGALFTANMHEPEPLTQKRFETFISAVANASSVTVFAALFLVRTLPRELHRGLHGCVLCTRVAEVPQRDSPVP